MSLKKYLTSIQYNTMIFVECGGKLRTEISVKPLAIYTSLNAVLKRDALICAPDNDKIQCEVIPV